MRRRVRTTANLPLPQLLPILSGKCLGHSIRSKCRNCSKFHVADQGTQLAFEIWLRNVKSTFRRSTCRLAWFPKWADSWRNWLALCSLKLCGSLHWTWMGRPSNDLGRAGAIYRLTHRGQYQTTTHHKASYFCKDFLFSPKDSSPET